MFEDCMLYAGAVSAKGYARIAVKIDGTWKLRQLHREVYLSYKGEIPEGYVIDHLCRNRHCFNPDHLEAVTNTENLNRGDRPNVYDTHCNKGHALSVVGFYLTKRGTKICKTCMSLYKKAEYIRNKDRIRFRQRQYYARKHGLSEPEA